MFQLYKNRNFSQYIGDTLEFFQKDFKNFFRGYFVINGSLLLVIIVLMAILMKIFYEGLKSNFGSSTFETAFERYMLENLGMFISMGGLLVVILMIISILNYLYPVSYLSLVAEKKPFETADIASRMKQKVGKALVFFIISFFVLMPVLAIIMVITFLLIFVIIGIPLLLILIPTFISFTTLAFYDYMLTENGYFTSLSNGFKILFHKFWHILGSTVIVYIFVQLVTNAITIIPYFFAAGSMLVNPKSMQSTDGTMPEGVGFLMVMMALLFVVAIVVSYVLQNIILVNQGIIYYSYKNETEKIETYSEIDSIGKTDE